MNEKYENHWDSCRIEIIDKFYENLSFIFYIAEGNSEFITSDNPVSTFFTKNSAKNTLFSVTPKIIIELKPCPDKYLIYKLNNEEVDNINSVIENQALNFIIAPPSSVESTVEKLI